ncbi:TetR/AcrR family transcriptional regulator [Actinomadura rugatobispora]|uniref:TetR family transcriptional regulator n=1 Tax=Actinomadura rugatobispora TaxID=1994 RepID=A0ABW1AI66_9ACTN|nr:TetR/AcrR family transcriptional regulator [Actinomadura rugatobispora]
MNTSAPGAGTFRSRVRRQLREDALDAAYRVVEERGWGAVRMTSVASSVGVSRQVLYKEFGSKDGLGEALLMREAQRFIDGVADEIRRHADVEAAIEASLRFGISQGAASPLLRAVLTSTLEGGDDTLLPLVTTSSERLVALSRQVLQEHITTRAPGLDAEDVESTADAVVRLLVSHLLLPLDDQETTVRRLTRLAARNLGL